MKKINLIVIFSTLVLLAEARANPCLSGSFLDSMAEVASQRLHPSAGGTIFSDVDSFQTNEGNVILEFYGNRIDEDEGKLTHYVAEAWCDPRIGEANIIGTESGSDELGK